MVYSDIIYESEGYHKVAGVNKLRDNIIEEDKILGKIGGCIAECIHHTEKELLL